MVLRSKHASFAFPCKACNKKEYPYLYNTVEGLALAAGLPTPKAYVIEDDAMNAFATGRDPKNSAIVVTTGLLKKMNREELEGLLPMKCII
jgi:heat shock protein HtpX